MNANNVGRLRSLFSLVGRYPIALCMGRWLFRKRVPWSLRRLGVAPAASTAHTHPYLYTLGEQLGMAGTLESVPKGGLVAVPQYFVGAAVALHGGDGTFVALTQFFQSPERAEHERARLSSTYPKAATFGVVRSFDPSDERQRAELAETRRRAVRGE